LISTIFTPKAGPKAAIAVAAGWDLRLIHRDPLQRSKCMRTPDEV